MTRVLVTGGSGFVAAHCLVQLQEAGHEVVTTVRARARGEEVRTRVRRGGGDPAAVELLEADLTADVGWDEAARGCEHVLHVASPFPPTVPRTDDELVVPAREGTLRVLRAASRAGVRRVVVTSSVAAVAYGGPSAGGVFTEDDWTDPAAPGVSAYARSKTLAERAAWEFVQGEGAGLELAVVNPVGVLGPALAPDGSTSISMVQRLLDGKVPGLARLSFGLVDVRDVADLHLRAMTDPAAAGERFLATGGELSLVELARALRAWDPAAASRVPTRVLPDWLVRLAAKVDRSLAQVVPELGEVRRASSEKAVRVLGWAPRSAADAAVATAESLVALGALRTR